MRWLVFLLVPLSVSLATPAISGLSIISDKEGYVANETVVITSYVSYAPGAPVYGANVTLKILNPNNETEATLSCTTDYDGFCSVSFEIPPNPKYGYWRIEGIAEFTGPSTNSTAEFDVHEEICGDGICDVNEPPHCEEDCGKYYGEECLDDHECFSEICCHNLCAPSCPYCGDGFCDPEELCACQEDCGACLEEGGGGGLMFFQSPLVISVTPKAQEVENWVADFSINLTNSANYTIENVTILLEGASEFHCLPKNLSLPPYSSSLAILSVKFKPGEYPGEHYILIQAVSDGVESNVENLTVVIKEEEGKEEKVVVSRRPTCGDESCDLGEDCMTCKEDCGPCISYVFSGDRDEAERAIRNAEDLLNSCLLILFKQELKKVEVFLEEAREAYRLLDFKRAKELALQGASILRVAQIKEIFAWSLLPFSLVLIKKFIPKSSKKEHKRRKKRS
ncbi:MAG: hypothetical protein J7L59_00470 [Nanoarchaeota archaeon]|nr:hypothetical protein [Nanoarchaeota archaeon]